MASEEGGSMKTTILLGLVCALGGLWACGGDELELEEPIQVMDLTSAGTLQRKTLSPATVVLMPSPLPTQDFDVRSKPMPYSPQDPIPIGLDVDDEESVDAGTSIPASRRSRRRPLDPDDVGDGASPGDRHRD